MSTPRIPAFRASVTLAMKGPGTNARAVNRVSASPVILLSLTALLLVVPALLRIELSGQMPAPERDEETGLIQRLALAPLAPFARLRCLRPTYSCDPIGMESPSGRSSHVQGSTASRPW